MSIFSAVISMSCSSFWAAIWIQPASLPISLLQIDKSKHQYYFNYFPLTRSLPHVAYMRFQGIASQKISNLLITKFQKYDLEDVKAGPDSSNRLFDQLLNSGKEHLIRWHKLKLYSLWGNSEIFTCTISSC